MKLFWGTLLAVTLLVATWCHAQSTEENLPSSESEPSETAAAEDDGQTTENPEPSSPSDGEDGQSEEPTEDGSPKPEADSEVTSEKPSKDGKQEQTGKGEGFSATYQEIGKILDSVDFKSVEDLHLQWMLENAYQARVRNPIRDQTGQIANFAPIRGCFGKLAGGVKTLINAAKKKFKTCNTGGDNSSGCSDQQENGFADGLISMASTLQGCISSKRKN